MVMFIIFIFRFIFLDVLCFVLVVVFQSREMWTVGNEKINQSRISIAHCSSIPTMLTPFDYKRLLILVCSYFVLGLLEGVTHIVNGHICLSCFAYG